jgi:hypothetical protein
VFVSWGSTVSSGPEQYLIDWPSVYVCVSLRAVCTRRLHVRIDWPSVYVCVSLRAVCTRRLHVRIDWPSVYVCILTCSLHQKTARKDRLTFCLCLYPYVQSAPKDWRTLHTEVLHNPYSSVSIIGMTEVTTRGLRNAARVGRKINWYKILLKEKNSYKT